MSNSDSSRLKTDNGDLVVSHQHRGLTKREHFAAMAMQGLLSNSGGVIQANRMSGFSWCNTSAEGMAGLAVACADALLEELEND